MNRFRNPQIRLWIDGDEIVQPTNWVLQLEIEERSNSASSIQLVIDMNPIEGDWDMLEHGSFSRERSLPNFGLMHRVTIELGMVADEDSESRIKSVVFDGYITSVEPSFGDEAMSRSQLVLNGLDTSCLMHFETVTKEWHGQSDSQIAQEIFRKYQFDVSDENIEATPLVRKRDSASLIQRCSDAEFLNLLSQRNGFEWFVQPKQVDVQRGPNPLSAIEAHFHSPRPHADPQPQLQLSASPNDNPTLLEFKARWESHLPTHIKSWHIDGNSRRIRNVEITSPGYEPLNGDRGGMTLAAILDRRFAEIFSNGTPPVPLDIQSADVPHDDTELGSIALSRFRDVDWFVSGEGCVNCHAYPTIIRSRLPIELSGLGHALDGKWYVREVHHRWAKNKDQPDNVDPLTRNYEADIYVVRNDLGDVS